MYFITCFEKCETHPKLGCFDGGCSRCFGYKEFLYDAERALNENHLDMHETIYHYAVIEKIGPYAFKNCAALKTVELPSTLTSIGESAFYACTSLEGIELPEKIL